MTLPLQFPIISPPQLAQQPQANAGAPFSQLAELLLAIRNQQRLEHGEARLARGESLDQFVALSKLVPGVLDTETGQGLLRDAGIDPQQVQQATKEGQARRETAITSTLKKVPPQWQPVIGTLIELHDVVDLPAEIKNDIAKSMLPEGVDHSAFLRFLGAWRTGAITAGQAADVAGFLLPPDFPHNLKVPRLGGRGTSATDKRLVAIARELTGLNTSLDNARIELAQERERIEKAEGIRSAGGRRIATPEQEQRAASAFNRMQQARFPKLSEWRHRVEQLQQEAEALNSNRSVPTESQTELDQSDLDEIDKLSLEALRATPSATKRSAAKR